MLRKLCVDAELEVAARPSLKARYPLRAAAPADRRCRPPPSSRRTDVGRPANPDLSLLDPLDLDKFTPTDRIHVLYNLAGTGVVQDMLRDLERRDAGRANAPSPAAHFYAPSPSPGFGGDIIDGDVTHGDLDAFFQSA